MRMRGIRHGPVALALFALLIGGCMPRVERPEVSLAGARVASLGLSGGVIDVRLSVYNPNGFRLRASGLTYDLDFENPDAEQEWLDFADGRIDRDVRIGPGETVEVTVPVEFTYRGLGDIVRGLMERGTFDYRVSGSVALEGPVRRAIPFRHSGTVTPGGVR